MQLYHIERHVYFPKLRGFDFYVFNTPKRVVINHYTITIYTPKEHVSVWGDQHATLSN